MSSIQAPGPYCCFQLVITPGQQFAFELFSNLTEYPGIMVAYLPSISDLQTVGNFLIAALNNQNPSPIQLSEEDGQRTLSMSALGPAVTITMYEANIQTTLSVVFSTMAHYFILATAGNLSQIWSGGQAEDSAGIIRRDH
ncbi:MAG: hypothetical protein M3362_04860 [Acidobacteriota bacterium]|nr:hypothetical protein [Acidobacteriota bacterium]